MNDPPGERSPARRGPRAKHEVPMRHARVSLQLGTLLVICAACARSGDGTGPGTAVIASITVSVNDTSIVVGGVTRLHATAKDASGASISGSSIAFASDSPGVATVSATGIVTGIAAGRARLRASAGSASATLILRVTPATGLAASVTIAPIAATLSVGANLPLTITVRDAAGAVAGRPVTWTSSDGTRAAVSPAGVVSGQAPGTVTVTATVDGAVGSASVSVVTPPSGTVLSAGPTRVYKTPCAAIAAAHTGDTIEIDAATYVGDVCTITTTGLTLRGIGGRPKLDAGGTSAQGKAIWVIHNPSTVVENIEFANATVPDNNGAGIKQEVGNLIVRNCYFDRNQMGILTGADSTSDIVIERSEFAFSGQTPTPGYEHNIYIGAVRSFTLRWSYSHDVYDGNLVKSRART